MKISRCILTFNVLSFLSATVLLVVSILRLVNGTTEVENDNLVDDCVRKLVHEAILIPIIISIGCAVAVMLTSFLGCYSSSAKSILGIIFFSAFHLIAILILIINCIILLNIWSLTGEDIYDSYKDKCDPSATVEYISVIQY